MRFLICLCMLGLTACSKPGPSPTGAGDGPGVDPVAEAVPKSGETRPDVGQANAAIEPDPPAEKPAKPTGPTLTEVSVRGLVDTWLKAQNEGDFAAYTAVYANTFEGIKRAGKRTYRFNRAGWLKDRGRMFRKPMAVAVEDVRAGVVGSAARVRLIQTWQSGAFKDRGPKVLVVVATPQGPRIAREEMLASTKQAPDSSHVRPDGFAFAWVEGRPYVVLGPAPEGIEGVPELVANRDITSVLVEIPQNPYAAVRGRSVALYAGEHKACSGRVTRVMALAAIIPHFGTRARWVGEEGPPTSRAEIAAAAWELSGYGGRWLVGEVSASAKACAGATWARFDDRPTRLLGRYGEPGAAIYRAVTKAFTTPKAYTKAQAEFEKETGESGPWHAGADDGLEIEAFGGGGAKIAFARTRAGQRCGGWYGELWAAYRVTGPPKKPVLEYLGGAPGYLAPKTVLDLNADGTFELLGRTNFGLDAVLLTLEKKGYTEAGTFFPLCMDCGC